MFKALGITTRPVFAGYVHINGQFERIDSNTKAVVSKFASYNKGCQFNWLPEVLTDLCNVYSGSHRYLPFFVNYKKKPLLPGRTTTARYTLSSTLDSLETEYTQYNERIVSLFKTLKASIADQLREAGHL